MPRGKAGQRTANRRFVAVSSGHAAQAQAEAGAGETDDHQKQEDRGGTEIRVHDAERPAQQQEYADHRVADRRVAGARFCRRKVDEIGFASHARTLMRDGGSEEESGRDEKRTGAGAAVFRADGLGRCARWSIDPGGGDLRATSDHSPHR